MSSIILGLRPRLAALACFPLRSPLPAGGQKKSSRDKGPRKIAELSHDVATGCALMKGEADPPIKPDSEYPEWLFKLLDPQPSAGELQKAYEGPAGLTMPQLQRLWRLQNKAKIKENNFARAK